jgi:hypothetical protein
VDGGRYGKGVRFDGDGDAVVIPDDPSLEPGAGDWTLEAWVNPDDTTGIRAVLAKWGGTCSTAYDAAYNACEVDMKYCCE